MPFSDVFLESLAPLLSSAVSCSTSPSSVSCSTSFSSYSCSTYFLVTTRSPPDEPLASLFLASGASLLSLATTTTL